MSDETNNGSEGILGKAKRLADRVGVYARSDDAREKLDLVKKKAAEAGKAASAGAKKIAEGTRQAAVQAREKADEFSKSERGEALKAKARQKLARIKEGSARGIRPWESPFFIGLSPLMCFPIGLVFVWRRPGWGTARKWAWTGAWAASMYLLLVFIGTNMNRKEGERAFAEAESLWAAGDRAGSVARYRAITEKNWEYLDSARKTTAFVRTIRYDVESGDMGRAKVLMMKALDASIPLPDLGARATDLLASARAERESGTRRDDRRQDDPKIAGRRAMLAEGDALWNAGRADDALKKYRQFWKSYDSRPRLTQGEKEAFGLHLPALYERTLEDYLYSYQKRPRELWGELREAEKLLQNASENGVSLPDGLVQRFRALKATPVEELSETKTYSVSKGFGRGKITIEITDLYDIGLEFSDLKLSSTGDLEFTAVWSPIRKAAPRSTWAAYDSKGVKLCDGTLWFGERIKAGEPTRGKMVMGYDDWKSTTKIKVE